MKKNGRCPAGQYYCYTNKECKPIPAGFMVDPEGMLRKENGATVDEANKSGDSSLRDWFSKSKSSDGKPGWVQLGGKYAGKPCARQPGQTTKPKCGSSKMKRNLSKDEEERAFRRKNAKDPNPDRKGKAINVATEETKKDHEYSMARSELKTVKNAAKRLEKKMGKKGEGNLEAWVQSKITKAADYIDTAADYVTNEEFVTLPLQIEVPNNIRDFNLGLMFRESLDQNSGMLFIFDEVAEQSFHMRETRIPLDIAFITEEGIIESIKELEPFDETAVASEGEVLCALEVNRGWFAENNVEVGDEIDIEEAAGEKDACYHKVKSRYSVWPSAYASGALVKCRKVGAKNWGNKTKKEEFELDEKFRTQYGDKTKLSQSSERKSLGRGSSIKDGSKKSGYESKKEFRDQSMKLRRHRERFGDLAKEETTLDEKCWKGYEKKGMKTMFGKRYPNCVKKEAVECNHTDTGVECPIHGMSPCKSAPKGGDGGKPGPNKNYVKPMGESVNEAVRIPARTGNIVDTYFNYRGKYYMLKMFFPQTSIPRRSDVQDQVSKVYPGARLLTFKVSDYEPGQPLLHTEGEAWTKKEGQNKSGGLNEKGRKSYERANPGSDLKAPSKKVGNPRRASFCARMKGMKKKLTSSKTANDPDSRINKSLRAWNC